jgi:hypothetical protein
LCVISAVAVAIGKLDPFAVRKRPVVSPKIVGPAPVESLPGLASSELATAVIIIIASSSSTGRRGVTRRTAEGKLRRSDVNPHGYSNYMHVS